MDLFTHALLGATLALAAGPGSARPTTGGGPTGSNTAGRTRHARLSMKERLMLGAAAAAFPDIDFLGFLIHPLVFLADWHQGPTHSLVLLPFWAVLVAALFTRLNGKRGAFAEAALISGLGLSSHIIADLITAYGTMVLYPLSSWRAGLGISFVLDPVFTAIVLAGLATSVWGRRPRAAQVGLIVLAVYMAGQARLQQHALRIAHAAIQERGFAATRVSALAQPFSPFNWKLIASNQHQHQVAHVNLAGHAPLVPPLPVLRRLHHMAAAFRPPAELEWQVHHRYGKREALRPMVERLWAEPRFAPFRRFASHPSLSALEEEGVGTCVWFTDLRYDLPALPDTFRYGFCREDPAQPWRLYRLRYFSKRDRQLLDP